MVWTQKRHTLMKSGRSSGSVDSWEGFLLVVTDISTSCVEVTFRIKWFVSWLVSWSAMLLFVTEFSRDVIGREYVRAPDYRPSLDFKDDFRTDCRNLNKRTKGVLPRTPLKRTDFIKVWDVWYLQSKNNDKNFKILYDTWENIKYSLHSNDPCNKYCVNYMKTKKKTTIHWHQLKTEQ